MALFKESGKVIGQLLTVLKYAAKVRNETYRFKPSPRKIKMLLMKPFGAFLNQSKSFFEGFRDSVKALPVPVMTKEIMTTRFEEIEMTSVGDPVIYGDQVSVEDLFDYWIYYAQEKSHIPDDSSGNKEKPRVGVAKPLFPDTTRISRLEQIKQRIRDKLKKIPSNPSKV